MSKKLGTVTSMLTGEEPRRQRPIVSYKPDETSMSQYVINPKPELPDAAVPDLPKDIISDEEENKGKETEKKNTTVVNGKATDGSYMQESYIPNMNQDAGLTDVELSSAMKANENDWKGETQPTKTDGTNNRATETRGTIDQQTEQGKKGNEFAVSEDKLGEMDTDGREELVFPSKRNFDQDYEKENPQPTRGRWNEQIFEEMNKRNQLTEEELKKQKRREIAQKAIAGFGDIATAAVNMAYANNGATPPVIPQGTPTMSGRYADKWAKWYEDYKQNRDKYAQGMENARKQDYAQYKADRDFWLKEKNDTRKSGEYDAKMLGRDLDNQLKMLKMQNLKDMEPEQRRLLEKKIESLEANIRKNSATAQYYANKPYDTTPKYKPVGSYNGKDFYNENDYKDAILEDAERYGIVTEDPIKGGMKDATLLKSEIATIKKAISLGIDVYDVKDGKKELKELSVIKEAINAKKNS